MGRGFAIRDALVPIVPGAIIFDLLNGGDKNWGTFSPYRDLGYAAAQAAHPEKFALGTVGAGTGATTASFKGGVGSASTRLASGAVVAALAVVNAVGSPTIGRARHFWAAPFEVDGEFGGLGWPSAITPEDVALRTKGMLATTIGLVATDAALTKAQCKRLAIMAHDGLARAVLPAQAPMDGDTDLCRRHRHGGGGGFDRSGPRGDAGDGAGDCAGASTKRPPCPIPGRRRRGDERARDGRLNVNSVCGASVCGRVSGVRSRAQPKIIQS